VSLVENSCISEKERKRIAKSRREWEPDPFFLKGTVRGRTKRPNDSVHLTYYRGSGKKPLEAKREIITLEEGGLDAACQRFAVCGKEQV